MQEFAAGRHIKYTPHSLIEGGERDIRWLGDMAIDEVLIPSSDDQLHQRHILRELLSVVSMGTMANCY